MEKNGMLTEKSLSDYDCAKKAEYYDAEGFTVADEKNKHKLNKPEALNNTQDTNE
jgi:hypothetical protein